jgi:flavin reductase (DIM6/NTAB) family NADH-FMN oxidoreductase RutF
VDERTAAMGLVNREAWVITAEDGARRSGLVATWVGPTSIDPERPALVAALAKNHYTSELVRARGRFVAHLLGVDQAEMALGFALGSGRARDKFAGIEVERTEHGPRLVRCAAWFACAVFREYDAGDRWLLWGDVVAARRMAEAGAGVLRERELIAGATPEQRGRMREELLRDVELQRGAVEGWRRG